MGYSVDIHEYTPTDVRLGRHVNHDSRNRNFAFSARFTPALVPTRHKTNIPVLDQGNIGACTGFAGAGLLGYDKYFLNLPGDKKDQLRASGETVGLNLYHTATTLDNISGSYPPSDTGSTGPASAKGMTKLGWANGYTHAFSMDAFLSALMLGPVMVGTVWYESMFEPLPGGVVTIDAASNIAGGHEYVADEYTGDGYIGFLNSWGASFGKSGRFYIKAEAFKVLLSKQGDVTVPVPRTAPAPIPTPTPPVPYPAVDQDLVAAFQSMKKWAKKNDVV